MKIFLLRHTSLDVANDIFYGQTDLDVSNTFLKEVKQIKKNYLLKKSISKKSMFFLVPLKRCIKLTKQITSNFTIDDRIKEMNLGDWEMKKMEDIPKNMLDEWENNLLAFKIPNGESNSQFLKRLDNFLENIIKQNNDVLVVCHAGSINGMISLLTNEPFDKLVKNYWEKIKHGSLSLIEVENGVIKKKNNWQMINLENFLMTRLLNFEKIQFLEEC